MQIRWQSYHQGNLYMNLLFIRVQFHHRTIHFLQNIDSRYPIICLQSYDMGVYSDVEVWYKFYLIHWNAICNILLYWTQFSYVWYIWLTLLLIDAEWRRYASVKHTIIASDICLSPFWCQAIIWTNAAILSIRHRRTYFSEFLFKIQKLSFKDINLKMLSVEWRPFCLGLNMLIYLNHSSSNGIALQVHSDSFKWHNFIPFIVCCLTQ